jgi:hypothetical protein
MEIRNGQTDMWVHVSGVAEYYVEAVGINND